MTSYLFGILTGMMISNIPPSKNTQEAKERIVEVNNLIKNVPPYYDPHYFAWLLNACENATTVYRPQTLHAYSRDHSSNNIPFDPSKAEEFFGKCLSQNNKGNISLTKNARISIEDGLHGIQTGAKSSFKPG